MDVRELPERIDEEPEPGLIDRLARLPAGRRGKWVVVVGWVLALVWLAPLAGKLAGAQQNEVAEWLPASAESTQAFHLTERFAGSQDVPLIVVYERSGPVTDADRAAVAEDAARFRTIAGVVSETVSAPIAAEDGRALMVLVPVHIGSAGWDRLVDIVADMRSHTAVPAGLSVHFTGPAGYAAEFGAVFERIDGVLLYASIAVVVVVLLCIYGPVLWIVPLCVAGVALTAAQAAVFGLTGHGLTVNALSAGVLLVLVFGAGTDYALLLIARYREELRRNTDRHEAMAVALRRARAAAAASGATVVIATLLLLAASMKSTQGLGPVCAIGVAVAVSAMLTLLPALLVITGRWVFWPRRPRVGTAAPAASGVWARIGSIVAARPRWVWVSTGCALAVLALGILGLRSHGVENKDAFVGAADSVTGEQIVDRHFDTTGGSPVRILVPADRASVTAAAVRADVGIAPGDVRVVAGDGDLTYLEGTLTDPATSAAAEATVERLRAEVHRVAGADARVGGDTAVRMDIAAASEHDRRLLVPLVLAAVAVVLMVLLRSVLAPVLLTATVVLSYLAALGIGAMIFHLLGFAGSGPGMPLLAFVFLVALGIDYNIFLMSRVREESVELGTERGALAALAATGSVITAAGLVLACTFAGLAFMPLVEWAELGIVIAVGVLLDTFVVRSILVTALTVDLGDRIWWPRRPNRSA